MITQDTSTPATEESSDSPKGLRDAKKRSDDRADGYRKDLVGLRLSGIGLNADEGLGVAIAESFEGEPTEEAIAAFAEDKYKYTYDAGTSTVTSTSAEQHQKTVEGGIKVVDQAEPLTPDQSDLQDKAREADQRFTPDPAGVDRGDVLQGINDKMNAHFNR